MTTIVSAYLYLPTNKIRTLEKYINNGKKLLQVDTNKIVFIDELLIDKFKEYSNDKTVLVPIKFTDLYLYHYRHFVKNNNINTDAPCKDTIEYFMIQCNKTEWLRTAIELNPYGSKNFVWVDFGIFHMFSDKVIEWNKLQNGYDKVRFPHMWDLNRPELLDVWKFSAFKDVMWFFAGSVIGGHKDMLIKFADCVKTQIIDLVERGILLWEVNIWYLVYRKHTDWFSPYHSGHDETIINNY